MKIPINNNKYLDKLVANIGSQNEILLVDSVEIQADWVVQTANWLEKRLGGVSAQWVAMDLAF